MWVPGAQPERPRMAASLLLSSASPLPTHRPLWRGGDRGEAPGSPCCRGGRPEWRACTRVREERWWFRGWNTHFRGERLQRQQRMAQWMLSRPCPHPVTFPFLGRQTAVPATAGPQPHPQAGNARVMPAAASPRDSGRWGTNIPLHRPLSGTTWGVVYPVSGGAQGD